MVYGGGRLSPKELKELYITRGDCHLIHGCKISLIALTLRTSLRVGSRCQIRTLRIILVLKEIEFIVEEPDVLPLKSLTLLHVCALRTGIVVDISCAELKPRLPSAVSFLWRLWIIQAS
jgi:hypothetical protein